MSREVTLHYFHGRGIGEPIRLILSAGEVPFTDRRYGIDEFAGMAELKARLPFGQIPALEVDGVFVAQADSAARLAARLAGLYPADPVDAARSDMIVLHQAEVQSAIAKMSFDGVPGAPGTQMVPEAERERRIAAWMKSTLPGHLERLERLAQEGTMVGSALSWADVCVFNRFNQLLDLDAGVLDRGLPKLRRVYEHVGGLPQIQSWIREHKDDYPRFASGPR